VGKTGDTFQAVSQFGVNEWVEVDDTNEAWLDDDDLALIVGDDDTDD